MVRCGHASHQLSEYRLALAYSHNPSKASLADFIRQHRLEHFQSLLRTVYYPLPSRNKLRPACRMFFRHRPGQLSDTGLAQMTLGRHKASLPALPFFWPVHWPSFGAVFKVQSPFFGKTTFNKRYLARIPLNLGAGEEAKFGVCGGILPPQTPNFASNAPGTGA